MGVVYLVDSENVGVSWKSIINPREDQRIFVFYTHNTPYISYEDLKFLIDSASSFNLIECFTGQNALDFQLTSFLGYLASKEELQNDEFIIVSNDKGYDPVCEFWSCRGYSVRRMTMSNSSTTETKIVNSSNDDTLLSVLPSEYKKDIGVVRRILQNDSLSEIHNDLRKVYGNEDGLMLYKLLRTKLTII